MLHRGNTWCPHCGTLGKLRVDHGDGGEGVTLYLVCGECTKTCSVEASVWGIPDAPGPSAGSEGAIRNEGE